MPRGDKPTTVALALKDGWVYEDALPKSITKKQYDWWFKESLVLDGVRMGPPLTTKLQSPTLEPVTRANQWLADYDSGKLTASDLYTRCLLKDLLNIINARVSAASDDLISRAAAKAALCYMCANPDRYKPAQPIEGRLFHFQGSDKWDPGECLAQAIDSVPALPAPAPSAAIQDEAAMPLSVKTGIDSIARHIARPIRGCATDDQYRDVVQRAADALTAAAETLTRKNTESSTHARAAAEEE